MTTKAVVFDAYGTLYDIQSVAAVTEHAFPGYGDIITQVWRLKQLEYTWLRSLMRRYADFSVVTRQSLAFTLRVLGLPDSGDAFERIMDKYLHLDLYPDARPALAALKGHRLAILSNGSRDMLDPLVRHSGLDTVLDATLSVETTATFKPSPEAYALVEDRLGVAPADVLFVSSNPFDVCGAKAFGFRVAWIERVRPDILAAALADRGHIAPLTLFRILRTQMDELDAAPDHRVQSLAELAALARDGAP
ncbi:haloacid dehalogenase type II [Bradyrhizobium sp. U87765 SZCCT0131]|uniref:haloacid dehalogenase type II n=1 Tax=unclassified Bradyrhizobium TaxID=2631580 RepID=UPI001BA73346|nr:MULTISPECIES: haloacid dehalogenase type II [unclassified Bradyrhizobium]MBR1220453.1 haloacid dehalogenase type II [Bradyrhizobium sp. U87765 SZCCT0131]MBR1263092.1 haloacid dehalogenase type II [Bradyrhizobium sp. U87765 SZCCT0134]MBR1307025.1 haloacid dehalogenase type II [Bradyrhizobium sp. U87765 SZCCT0110]MBR1323087.1 haloacid dehalogenase type II [Bradyrhizobium sp. U87765 SZCCT0109]MBR1345979.1 haloacid dehalogenase type II [Bradyrhizobium sp. U87765 SZCCT0048]